MFYEMSERQSKYTVYIMFFGRPVLSFYTHSLWKFGCTNCEIMTLFILAGAPEA